ncbi:uncharacterized protein LOC127846618 [Dreissena polymorpha]|uniref:uncharacterized protein LOC127846618 n=1 Tax=Dreissena polymorpha TaxID=45954 RepID=UPI0022647E69|nr:uncharacterized protein LOC127846618 [Dreissena polymorpha]XP_052234005.1 uncharacterized protein LOC127846618 [Dreissena polymorpha]XP_052234006.1 uncharacterized protein LOC127846618 [Dreissena polymorpha]XP_052234007.1 uncharacterized protein LOC127846618 [Dreissena polymorpha]XP_052234009.1 uncharacterized protein LOC127846618 [Dreissena polymorpha]
MACIKQPVNCLTEEELRSIPGISSRLASTIVDVRNRSGNLTAESFQTLRRQSLSENVTQLLDFTPNRQLGKDRSQQSPNIMLGAIPKKVKVPMPGSPKFEKQANGDASEKLVSEVAQWQDVQEVLSTAKKLVAAKKQGDCSAFSDFLTNAQQQLNFVKDNLRRREDSDDDLESSSGIPKIKNARAKMYRKKITHHTVTGRGVSSEEEDQPILHRTSSAIAYSNHLPASKLPQPVLGSDRTQFQRGQPFSRSALRDIPKNLVYDGKSRWQSFHMKFEQYERSFGWTAEDCKMCLLHCMSGTALDYCARIMKSNPEVPYRILLNKLEGRFGAELAESSQAKFATVIQKKGESMEDWGDRVQALATEAFRDLPETFCNQQAIDRFCQGLLDIDAGHNTFMKRHRTIEAAMNDIRLFQHSKGAMLGGRTKVTQKAMDYNDTNAYICSVHSHSDKESITDFSTLQKELIKIKEQLNELAVGQKRRPWRNNRTPSRLNERKCFACDETGHFVSNCPYKQEILNLKGSS